VDRRKNTKQIPAKLTTSFQGTEQLRFNYVAGSKSWTKIEQPTQVIHYLQQLAKTLVGVTRNKQILLKKFRPPLLLSTAYYASTKTQI